MAPTAEDNTALPSIVSLEAFLEDDEESGDDLLTDAAWRELGETRQIRLSSQLQLRHYVESSSHLENCRLDPEFLLRFARFQKHEITKSCSMLENYLNMRNSHPHWFQNLDVRDVKLSELVQSGYVFALPERDKEGRRVVFSVAGALDPSRHTNGDAMRAHLLTFEALMEEEENQVKGLSYIFDCSGLTLGHIAIWTPSEIGKVFAICEKNLPVRHRDINMLSLPFPMRAVFEFCKSLLSEKIRKRFSVYSSLEKLTLKLGDRAESVLPQEYGGTVPIQDMTRSWAEHLEKVRPALLGLDTMKVQDKKPVKVKESRSSLWDWIPSFSHNM